MQAAREERKLHSVGYSKVEPENVKFFDLNDVCFDSLRSQEAFPYPEQVK